ncbi:DoxX family protein [Flavobacterium granuli]|uniref:Membrane protein YphA (DoxX/SURF4 family) n=1 Tax=Flavobacterium granuli TaxID=280093 RepID=A0ABU1S139_9FLAO|nr:DoxX family protein [Flavobacterium granuli]MDR6844632.1 putative membrane protein YphA (DoxX/SURF4 family) [Flavobacterium granuli]
MKIATIIIRSLIGLLLLFASISYFLNLFPEPPLAGNMKIFNDGLKASGYLIPLVKTIELICGLSFIIGKFNKLTFILLMPISVNIICTHIFLAPEGIPVAAFLFLGNIFLLYTKWNSYKGLFTA